MLQVYYLNLKNSNLTAMKSCLSIHQTNLALLSPQQRSLMLGIVVGFDGTSKVDANNIATDIREQNFSKAEGIET